MRSNLKSNNYVFNNHFFQNIKIKVTLSIKRILKIILVSESEREKGTRGSYFEITQNDRSFIAKKASLYLYVKPQAGRTKNETYINIVKYRTAADGTLESFSGPRRKVKLLNDKGHWKKLDILSHVNKWLANDKEERRIRIYAEDDQILSVDFTDKNSPYVSFTFSCKIILFK